MFNKLYVKIKEYIKENAIELGVFLFFLLLSVYPLPYYIDLPGGLLNTSKRVEVEGATKQEGTYNLAYVSEIQATPVLYLFALINDEWDLTKEEEMTLDGQTIDELFIYERLLLKQGSNNAKIVAYRKALKEVEISNEELTIAYIAKEADTNLEVGDVILTADNQTFNSVEEMKSILEEKNIGDIISFEVISGEDKVTKTAKLKLIDGKVGVGIAIISNKEVTTKPKCSLNFEDKETGPSGGLMTALTIYDYLVEDDLTHGLTIAGTGTIDENGNVGSIGGVKYKLAGVVKEKADIFFIPAGENYEEAMKLKKEHDYDIDIVSVSTFDDAIEYLSNLK